MLTEQTIDKLQAMNLHGMAEALDRQRNDGKHVSLSFEERMGLLVDHEWTQREQRKLDRRLKQAKLRHDAALEDVDYTPGRGLDRQVVLSLGSCSWIAEHQNVIVSGSTGTGKSYLACALAERACRKGYTAQYTRMPRLLQELMVARGDGSYSRLLTRLAKLDLLVIDDWLLSPLKETERRDLLEVVEDRAERGSTLLAGQLPVKSWHEVIGEAMVADAILDRLVHRSHRIALKGPSQRESRSAIKAAEKSK